MMGRTIAFPLMLVFLIVGVAHAKIDATLMLSKKENIQVGERVAMSIAMPDETFQSMRMEFSDAERLAVVVQEIRKEGQRFTAVLRPLRAGYTEFQPKIEVQNSEGEWLPVNATHFELRVEEPAATESQEMEFTAPREVPFDYTLRNIIIAAIVVLLLAILALLSWIILRVYRRIDRTRPTAPPIPPVESALMTVRRLKSLKVFADAGPNAHYTLLSNTMRRYLEEQFGVSALEMTEDEVVAFLEQELSKRTETGSLRDVFLRSSMAKFARQELTQDVAARDCDVSEEFLLREKERLNREKTAQPDQAEEGKAA